MLDGDTPFQAMGRNMLHRLKETPGRFDYVRNNINGQKSFRELFTFIFDLQESHEYLKPAFMRSQKSSQIASNYWDSGNYYYKKGEFERAMECYNLSLVLAPHPFLEEDPNMYYGHDGEDPFVPERIEPYRYNTAETINEDSTALAMAYANRSAVFYKLGLYDRCLRDIRLALQNDYPVQYKNVLEKREKNCLKALAGGKRKTRAAPKSEKQSCRKRKDSTCLEDMFSALNIEFSCSEINSTDLVKKNLNSGETPSGSDKNSSSLNKNSFETGKTSNSSTHDATGTDKECSNSGRKTSNLNRSSRRSGKEPYKRSSKAGKDTNRSYKGSTTSRKHICNCNSNKSSCSSCIESSKSDQRACGSNIDTKSSHQDSRGSSNDNPSKSSSDKNEEPLSSNKNSLVSGKDTHLSNMETLGAANTGETDSNLATCSPPTAPFCLDIKLPDFTTTFTGPDGESDFTASLKKRISNNSNTKYLDSGEEFPQVTRSCSPAKDVNSVINDNVSNKEDSRLSTESINESTNFGLQTCNADNNPDTIANLKNGNSSSSDIKSVRSSKEPPQLKSSLEASHSKESSCGSPKDSSLMKSDSVSDKESLVQSTEAVNESNNFSQQTCTSDNVNPETTARRKNRNSSGSESKSLGSSQDSSSEVSHSGKISCGSGKDSKQTKSDSVSGNESSRRSTAANNESSNSSQQACTTDNMNPDATTRIKNSNSSSSKMKSRGSKKKSSKPKSSCGSAKDSSSVKSDNVSDEKSSRQSTDTISESNNSNQQASAPDNINPGATARKKNRNSSSSKMKALGSSNEPSKLKSSLEASHSEKSSCGSAKDSSSRKSNNVSDKKSSRQPTEVISESTAFSQENMTSNINLDVSPDIYDSDTVSTGSNDEFEDTANESRKAMLDLLETKPISDHSGGSQRIKSLFTSDECRSPVIKDPHPEIPAFTNAVSVGHHSVKGKGIFANRYIRPGEVLAVEPAFCISADWKRLAFACGYCLKDVIDPLPCPGCVLVTFCSEACRYEALAEDHWLECAILPTLDALGLHHRNLAYKIFKTLDYPHLVALLDEGKKKRPRRRKTKAGARKRAQQNKVKPKIAASHRCWQDMCTNVDKQSFEYLFVQCQTAFILTTLLVQSRKFFVDEDGIGIDPSREAVLRTGAVVLSNILKIRSNALEIIDKKRKISLGVGIYHSISMINHSCNPSAEEYNCGRDMVIRAIRPIYEGEEITISYVWNYYEARQEDRTTDLFMYSIICSCEACLFGWGTYYQLPYVAMNLLEKEAQTEEFANAITDSLQVGVKITSGIRISPEERETLVRAIELLYILAPMPCQDFCYVQKLLLMSFLLERN